MTSDPTRNADAVTEDQERLSKESRSDTVWRRDRKLYRVEDDLLEDQRWTEWDWTEQDPEETGLRPKDDDCADKNPKE